MWVIRHGAVASLAVRKRRPWRSRWRRIPAVVLDASAAPKCGGRHDRPGPVWENAHVAVVQRRRADDEDRPRSPCSGPPPAARVAAAASARASAYSLGDVVPSRVRCACGSLRDAGCTPRGGSGSSRMGQSGVSSPRLRPCRFMHLATVVISGGAGPETGSAHFCGGSRTVGCTASRHGLWATIRSMMCWGPGAGCRGLRGVHPWPSAYPMPPGTSGHS